MPVRACRRPRAPGRFPTRWRSRSAPPTRRCKTEGDTVELDRSFVRGDHRCGTPTPRLGPWYCPLMIANKHKPPCGPLSTDPSFQGGTLLYWPTSAAETLSLGKSVGSKEKTASGMLLSIRSARRVVNGTHGLTNKRTRCEEHRTLHDWRHRSDRADPGLPDSALSCSFFSQSTVARLNAVIHPSGSRKIWMSQVVASFGERP